MVHGTLMYQVDVDVLTNVLNTSHSKLQSKGIASVRSRVANLSDYLPELADIQSFAEKQHCSYQHDDRPGRIDRTDYGQREMFQSEITAYP